MIAVLLQPSPQAAAETSGILIGRAITFCLFLIEALAKADGIKQALMQPVLQLRIFLFGGQGRTDSRQIGFADLDAQSAPEG